MKLLGFFLFLLATTTLQAQLPPSPDSVALVTLNQRIDDLVMKQQAGTLDSLYATDFVFSHGSGNIQNKANWLISVGRNKYPIRKHDSVRVQQHGDIAVLKGRMYIERLAKEQVVKYQLKYIRIYAIRNNRWQLVSHNTTEETHL